MVRYPNFLRIKGEFLFSEVEQEKFFFNAYFPVHVYKYDLNSYRPSIAAFTRENQVISSIYPSQTIAELNNLKNKNLTNRAERVRF